MKKKTSVKDCQNLAVQLQDMRTNPDYDKRINEAGKGFLKQIVDDCSFLDSSSNTCCALLFISHPIKNLYRTVAATFHAI
jgi:hypothetical protein